jgi:phosphopantothenate-cysteine ligase
MDAESHASASTSAKVNRPSLPQSTSNSSFSADDFFATQQAPPNLSSHASLAREFVERHQREGRKVVLVTSGGTTVPLERNVVRFLDNFSAGTRGATSAEYFLSAGYAVIFMHRQHSLSPYTRHYSHTRNPFLDLLSDPVTQDDHEEITVLPEHTALLLPVLRDYHQARKAGTLLRLTFVTVSDYLFMLREMSKVMQPLGRSGMYYLAAAVSDFYVPSQKTVSVDEYFKKMISVSPLYCFTLARTQDPIREGFSGNGNGSSTQGTQTDGTAMGA